VAVATLLHAREQATSTSIFCFCWWWWWGTKRVDQQVRIQRAPAAAKLHEAPQPAAPGRSAAARRQQPPARPGRSSDRCLLRRWPGALPARHFGVWSDGGLQSGRCSVDQHPGAAACRHQRLPMLTRQALRHYVLACACLW